MRKPSKKMRKAAQKAQGTFINHKKLQKINKDTATEDELLKQQQQLADNLENEGDESGAELVRDLVKKVSDNRKNDTVGNNRILEQIAKTNAIIVSKLDSNPKNKQDTKIHREMNLEDILSRLESLENDDKKTEQEPEQEKPKSFLSMLLSNVSVLATALFSGVVMKTIIKPIMKKMIVGIVKGIFKVGKLGVKVISQLAMSAGRIVGPALRMILTKAGPIGLIVGALVGSYKLFEWVAKKQGYTGAEELFSHYVDKSLIAMGMDNKLLRDMHDRGFAQAASDYYFGVRSTDVMKIKEAKAKIKEKGLGVIEQALEDAGAIDFSNMPKFAGFMSFIRMRSAMTRLDSKTLKYLIANYNWVPTDMKVLKGALKFRKTREKYTDEEWATKKKKEQESEKKAKIAQQKSAKLSKIVDYLANQDENYTEAKDKYKVLMKERSAMIKAATAQPGGYKALVKTDRYKEISMKIAMNWKKIQTIKNDIKSRKSTKELIEQEEKNPTDISTKFSSESIHVNVKKGNKKKATKLSQRFSEIINTNGKNVDGLNDNFKKNLIGMAEEFSRLNPGKKIGLASAYRTIEEQRRLFLNKRDELRKKYPKWTNSDIEREVRKWVAVPGRSMHNHGVAVDLDKFSRNNVSDDLLKKYNLWRSMKKINPKETWHIQPIGIDEEKIRETGEVQIENDSNIKAKFSSFMGLFSGVEQEEKVESPIKSSAEEFNYKQPVAPTIKPGNKNTVNNTFNVDKSTVKKYNLGTIESPRNLHNTTILKRNSFDIPQKTSRGNYINNRYISNVNSTTKYNVNNVNNENSNVAVNNEESKSFGQKITKEKPKSVTSEPVQSLGAEDNGNKTSKVNKYKIRLNRLKKMRHKHKKQKNKAKFNKANTEIKRMESIGEENWNTPKDTKKNTTKVVSTIEEKLKKKRELFKKRKKEWKRKTTVYDSTHKEERERVKVLLTEKTKLFNNYDIIHEKLQKMYSDKLNNDIDMNKYQELTQEKRIIDERIKMIQIELDSLNVKRRKEIKKMKWEKPQSSKDKKIKSVENISTNLNNTTKVFNNTTSVKNDSGTTTTIINNQQVQPQNDGVKIGQAFENTNIQDF